MFNFFKNKNESAFERKPNTIPQSNEAEGYLRSICRNKRVYISVESLITFFMGDATKEGSYDKGEILNMLKDHQKSSEAFFRERGEM